MLFTAQSQKRETSPQVRAATPHCAEESDAPPPSERLGLADLWAGIRAGTHYVQEGYYSEDRCFLTVEHRVAAPRRRRPLRMAVLERILAGESYKAVAFENRLAVSTIAIACGECLDAIGKVRLASRAPALMVMAVHAFRGLPLEPARMYRVENDGKEQLVITAERPDRTLPPELTPSEAAVIRLLVEGHTHEQIGILRSTSRRTVANQLAAAFHKIGVSGRAELLALLIRRAADVTLSPRAASLPLVQERALGEHQLSSKALPNAARGTTLSS